MTATQPRPTSNAIEAPDDDPAHPPRGDGNPFPGSDKRMWTDHFSSALSAASGLPRDITDFLAPYVTRPKRFLVRRDKEWVLAPGVFGITETGERTLNVEMHGFAGNSGEFNERINSFYAAPFKPRRDNDTQPVRPSLVTGSTSSGKLAPYITTARAVSHDELNAVLGTMSVALEIINGDRTYNLAEDMEVHGQQQPTTHVVLKRRIREPDGDGGSRIRELVDLTAVQGANRTMARLNLFGLTPKDIVFGVRPRTVMNVKTANELPTTDTRRWVPVFADLLAEAYDDPEHPGHELACRARAIATVKVRIIIGPSRPDALSDFASSVFDANRIDHRRPPLEYRVVDRSSADFRALLRDLKQHRLLDEATRAWLAGEALDPQASASESIIDARDRRDRALLAAVFPPDEERRRRVRVVLGEPARSQTGSKHVNARARMYSAAATDGYATLWNPRVMDGVFSARTIKDRETYSKLAPWSEVRAAAEAGDFSMLDDFIQTRGIHWLVDAGLIEADRGSLGAQTATDNTNTDESPQRLERRTIANLRAAMAHKQQAAFGLLLELAHATEHRTDPRRVDDDGTPQNDTKATKLWLQNAFPKKSGGRGGNNHENDLPPDTPPTPPTPDPHAVRLIAQSAFQNAVMADMINVVQTVFTAGVHLLDASEAAGVLPLSTGTEEVVESIEKALIAIGEDIETLTSQVSKLKYGKAKRADFEQSASELYAEEVAE
ncbi:hypothetical protein AB0N89_20395 [Amycolatopsis sp. NPDC089917]|uniref:hypothetical protein n=1 Tax=Amycolatopsis sp. NPDC089917 TaxID=3155187 RepID=UPI003427090D